MSLDYVALQEASTSLGLSGPLRAAAGLFSVSVLGLSSWLLHRAAASRPARSAHDLQPGPPLLQALPLAHRLPTSSCVFTYGPFAAAVVVGDAVTAEEGWLYGARLGPGELAIITDKPGDVLHGRLLCFAPSAVHRQVAELDGWAGRLSLHNGLRRSLRSVWRTDGSAVSAYCYHRDDEHASAVVDSQPSDAAALVRGFEVVGYTGPRPPGEHLLFCDGTGGANYNPDTDLELSHWRPNHTPDQYKAGTSTEESFLFLARPRRGPWTVVSNHADVDGILSAYALVHSEHALVHRQTIIEAAEIGDFWGWGELPAQRLFQGLTHITKTGKKAGRSYAQIFQECFERVPGLIDGSDKEASTLESAVAPLHRGLALLTQGRIRRTLLSPKLAHYVIPLSVAGEKDELWNKTAGFNEAVSERLLFWPQARAKQDFERVCLISVQRPRGYFHELAFPGYLWADTAGLWTPAGLKFLDNSEYELHNQGLLTAFRTLRSREQTGRGQWSLGGTEFSLGAVLTDQFPTVGGFLTAEGGRAISSLSPDQVAAALKDTSWDKYVNYHY